MNSPLKYHGGKHYLASQIVALMPPHLHYVEPYFGGGAVLFAKPSEGISEVANDLNGNLMNFWRVLQDKKSFAEFKRRIEATPFSETEWQDARNQLGQLNGTLSRQEQIDRAARFFVLCRQSMSGRCKDFTPLTRNRTRRGMNEWPARSHGKDRPLLFHKPFRLPCGSRSVFVRRGWPHTLFPSSWPPGSRSSGSARTSTGTSSPDALAQSIVLPRTHGFARVLPEDRSHAS